MILAKKVRLIPTPEQEKVLRNHAGAARFAYNYCKRMSDRYYKLFGKSVSQLALQKRYCLVWSVIPLVPSGLREHAEALTCVNLIELYRFS
ncbi:hypothetical protein COD05_21645 [Bacillus cereus]|nr:helix-turn-helix domain-containing protein [Bacillus wiedmannii]PFM85738.1 hypothetical protein COJ53_24975 [Bacillus cereus]RFB77871.1 hypothetical protein DZB94_06050 [Bacillus sp. AW]PFQ88484.1 hypothetical protein COK28_20820 [Bacillus cereus]PGP35033.1 hypothetical protein CN989_17895 [Bacillus cereus]